MYWVYECLVKQSKKKGETKQQFRDRIIRKNGLDAFKILTPELLAYMDEIWSDKRFIQIPESIYNQLIQANESIQISHQDFQL